MITRGLKEDMPGTVAAIPSPTVRLAICLPSLTEKLYRYHHHRLRP